MPLKERELENTILKKISIDEYEPKTGDAPEVMVIGFFVVQDLPGEDLFLFINNSAIDIRDVEVSPNPNADNYYMVFVEIDRNDSSIHTLKEILREVERVSGKLDWAIRSNLIDQYVDINDKSLPDYIQTDPNNYLSRKEWLDLRRNKQEETEVKTIDEKVLSFLKNTNLLNAEIKENRLNISGADGLISLEMVEFGNGRLIKKKLGITESAIRQDFDHPYYAKLNNMLGGLSAIPIDDYVIIFNPITEQVLVAKQT